MNYPYNNPELVEGERKTLDRQTYIVERVYLGKYSAQEALKRIVKAKIELYRSR